MLLWTLPGAPANTEALCHRFEDLSAMRFMLIFKPLVSQEEKAPPCMELSAMGELMGELGRAGILLASEGLQPSASGARVSLEQGRFTVVDGPFAEAKELVAGFALVQVGSKDEAIALARRFLSVAGEGQSEVRRVYDDGDFPERE